MRKEIAKKLFIVLKKTSSFETDNKMLLSLELMATHHFHVSLLINERLPIYCLCNSVKAAI